jgi:hypothetical protein
VVGFCERCDEPPVSGAMDLGRLVAENDTMIMDDTLGWV